MNSNICDKLIENYNTTKYNNKDEFLKKICEFIVTNKLNISKKILYQCNYTLIKLFYNKFFKQIPRFSNIVGPCSLVLFKSEKYKKTIYVFGEYHCDNNNIAGICPSSKYVTISNLMSECSNNTPVFLDIFVEFPITAKEKKFPRGIIGNIATSSNEMCFNNHTQKNRIDNDECSTTRWHYTDIRYDEFFNQTSLAGHIYYELAQYNLNGILCDRTVLWEKLIFKDLVKISINDKVFKNLKKRPDTKRHDTIPRSPELTNYLKFKNIKNFGDYKYNLIEYFIFKIYSQDIIKLCEYILTENITKIQGWFWDQFANKLLVKEINRSYESLKILRFLNDQIEKITLDKMSEMKIVAEKIIKVTFLSTYVFFTSINILTDYIANISVLFADSYTLSRIFKKFSLIKHMPDTPKNIIFYAGENHAKNMRRFFEFGIDSFTKVAKSYNNSCPMETITSLKYRCCLNIDDFPQPLFNLNDSS